MADQLDAKLTYEWMTKGAPWYGLQPGDCDIVMGVTDGTDNFLTTPAYYQSTYVFVCRADSPFEIESFNDPELENLGIGLPLAVQAVVEAEVDVAIDWGPVAAHFTRRQPVELEFVPVRPQIMPPFLPMSYPTTIGVRLGDVALRDRLNIALAKRWEDIQEVLRNYMVCRSGPCPSRLL